MSGVTFGLLRDCTVSTAMGAMDFSSYVLLWHLCVLTTAGGFYLGHSLGLACRPTNTAFFSGFSLAGCVFSLRFQSWLGDWSRSCGGCRVVCFRFFGNLPYQCACFSRDWARLEQKKSSSCLSEILVCPVAREISGFVCKKRSGVS